MAGLISGAGIQLPGGDGLPARLLTWEEIAKGNQVWTFVNLMLARLTYVDADEVAAILDDLCLGNMTITYPGGEPVEIEKVGQLNALVPDVVHLLTLLRYAIEVNARPTSPGSPAGPGQTPTTISDT